MWLDYVEERIATATALDAGERGGLYSDACILISAIISGIAAELWPGKGIDRVRFVQLWTVYAEKKLEPNLISVPLLTQDLRNRGKDETAQRIESLRPHMFGLGYGSVVLRSVDVDIPESELLMAVPELTPKDIRPFSYAPVFYTHVRSNLVHEWKLSRHASSQPATRLPADISYVNRSDPASLSLSRRMIHFHIEWLAKLVRSLATNTAPLIESYQTLTVPKTWWVSEV